MVKINISYGQFNPTVANCKRFISPTKFWINPRVGGKVTGGEGWVIVRTNEGYVLEIEDDKKAVMLALSTKVDV